LKGEEVLEGIKKALSFGNRLFIVFDSFRVVDILKFTYKSGDRFLSGGV
jgi:hypothetical protein